MSADILALDLPPILIGMLAAIACALPGNFLILRRQALIGDAISHVVLPGIVVAFLVTGSSATWPMLLGAGAALFPQVAFARADAALYEAKKAGRDQVVQSAPVEPAAKTASAAA